jgi:hypothetical protein
VMTEIPVSMHGQLSKSSIIKYSLSKIFVFNSTCLAEMVD